MRVLVVASHVPWPLDHGGRLRLYHLLRAVSCEAQVTLAVAQPPASADALAQSLRIVEMTHANGRVIPAAAVESSFTFRQAASYFGVNRAVEGWLGRHATPRNFDVALISGPAMGLYAAAIRVPVVWDAVDHLPLYALREGEVGGPRAWLASAKSIIRMGLYERAVSRRAAVTLYSSTVDASYARRWSDARIETVSNGVDFDYFQDAGATPDPRTIAFVGALSFPPNVDAVCTFAHRVWPRLLERDGARRWLLVGREPDDRVRALAHLPGVELAADVKDVRPYMARAAVMIAPTRAGGGVKNKVIEGCAMNRLVVASRRAVAGLSARPGCDLLVATSPCTWIRAIDAALRGDAKYERIRQSGYAWVRANHNWNTLGTRVVHLLEKAARRAAGRRRLTDAAAPPVVATATEGANSTDTRWMGTDGQAPPCTASRPSGGRRRRRSEVRSWR